MKAHDWTGLESIVGGPEVNVVAAEEMQEEMEAVEVVEKDGSTGSAATMHVVKADTKT